MSIPALAPAIPRATVRLQLHAGFTLFDAADTVPYYASLGISHLYVSPIQQARRGSTHGYDGTDPTQVDAERGGREGLRALIAALRAHAMGLIVDIAPNHLSSSLENPWWFDVLERGRASRYAGFFAIDRDDPDPGLRDRVLLPFLADDLGALLAREAIAIRLDETRARLVVDVEGTAYPFAADAYVSLLADATPRAAGESAQPDSALALLKDVLGDPDAKVRLDAKLAAINADPQALRGWLDRQNYVLCSWRDASRRLNWRRFFDIAELIALRSDDDAEFEAFHALIFKLYAAGEIDGLRIDHVDGLAEPERYCTKLRERLAQLEPQRPATAPRGPAYLVVEKILAEGEPLRQWPVAGTTGYDFMDQVGALMHDARGCETLDAMWLDLGGTPLAAIESASRSEVLEASFGPELARACRAAADALPHIEEAALQDALARLAIAYTRYRGYARVGIVDAEDRDPLNHAATEAIAAGADPVAASALVRLFVGETLELDATAAERALRAFQHLTAPLAARAIEDTAFYRYARLLSRNEVGASPATFASSVERFHGQMAARARSPHAMLATATHDHKRGEDTRMRIASIAADSDAWRACVERWRQRNARLRPHDAPDAIDEYMLYQTLVGSWADARSTHVSAEFRTRIREWQVKSIRERKQHGTWAEPDAQYERRAGDFVDALLADAAFVTELTFFLQRIEAAAAIRSVSQTTLRLTCPGVPDMYQGCEFQDFSLVDPDNRRPVDYASRRAALEERADDASVLESWRDGRAKQRLIARLLRERARSPALFDAPYVPLQIDGPRAKDFIAFARAGEVGRLIVVAFVAPRGGVNECVRLVPGQVSETVLVSDAEGVAYDVVGRREVRILHRTPLSALLEAWPVCVIRLK
ncbi:MAG: malto-oligosyltrehalose synthase [Rhodanobacteraceae bacterium]